MSFEPFIVFMKNSIVLEVPLFGINTGTLFVYYSVRI